MNKFRRKCGGQVTAELMLILPVFMLMIFFVLEYGNIAYHTIIANHASYEFARIGSLVGVKKPSGRPDRTVITQKINQAKQKVFGTKAGGIAVNDGYVSRAFAVPGHQLCAGERTAQGGHPQNTGYGPDAD